MNASGSMGVVSTAPALHELWCNPDRSALLALRPSAGGGSRGAATYVRAAALDVVDALVGRKASALSDLERGRSAWRPRDCLATDLLAGSLLAEAIGGDETARIAITHLRRQRLLEDFEWPHLAPTSEPDDLADGEEAAELVALLP